MIRRTVASILLAVIILMPVWGLGEEPPAAFLKSVTRTDESDSVQLYFRFSRLPAVTTDTVGRRLDVVMAATLPAEDLPLPKTDDRIIKFVHRTSPENLALAVYFRYPPQQVTIRKNSSTATLMIDILLGNPFSARYPDLSSQLHGLTLLNRNEIDFSNPLHRSPYGNQWRLFLREYESPVTITPFFALTLPPFPLAEYISPQTPGRQWLSEANQHFANNGKWHELAVSLRDDLEKEPDEQNRIRLLLSYGEALVRAGEYREPYTLLQQISLTYPDSDQDLLARLLFLFLVANHEDPFLARLELKKILSSFLPDHPLAPYVNIFLAELDLLTDRIEQAATTLARDDLAYTGRARLLRLLRQADTYAMQGESIKALVAYRKLDRGQPVIDTHPRSLAMYGAALYQSGRYREALNVYQRLSELTTGKNIQHLVLYRLAMSRLHAGEKEIKIFPLLSQIRNAYPGSEGAFRAWLKQTDLHYLSGRVDAEKSILAYQQIGRQGNRKQIREEARVKEAMVNALAGQHRRSIDLAMTILRDFRSGSLRIQAQALILAQLPSVLKAMIREKQYLKALVLAKKNRYFFARGWLDVAILYDLAKAYEALGVYDRAVRAYRYILDVANSEQKEKVYIPLLEALLKDRQYNLLEDYADQYFSRYPNGPSTEKVFLLRVQGLMDKDDLKGAARLLSQDKRPVSPEIEAQWVQVAFALGDWKRVIDLLTGSGPAPAVKDPIQARYYLAEAYFQDGEYDKARPLFEGLTNSTVYREQSMYRLAEIDLKTGRIDQARQTLTALAKKGTDPRWIRMAREELALLKLEPELQAIR